MTASSIPALTPENRLRLAEMNAHNKGANCANTVECIRESLGVAGFAAFVESMPPATAALLRRRLLAVEWVPLHDWAPIIEGICDQLDRDEEQMLAISRQWCRADFGGIYRFFLRFGSPEFILERTSKVWHTYFDVGELVVTERRRDRDRKVFVTELRSFAPWPVFATTLQGFMEEVLVMSGAKESKVERKANEIRQGELYCRYELSYE